MSEGGKIVEKMSEGVKLLQNCPGVKRKKMTDGGKKILFCVRGGKENTRF